MDRKRHSWDQTVFGLGMLGVLLLSGVSTQAEQTADSETEAPVTNSVALKVDVRRNVEGTHMPYRFAFVTAGTEKFTFLIPEDYRVDTSDPSKVKLASADYSVMIVVGVSGGMPAGTKMTAEALQARVLSSYPETVIKRDLTVAANEQSAPALDFTWKAQTGITRMTRTTFIPTTAGLMEFTLTASPDKFEASLRELNLVMLTFRSGVNGKFDYVVGSKLP